MTVSDINNIGTALSADLLAWGAVAITLCITYVGILYVQRILK